MYHDVIDVYEGVLFGDGRMEKFKKRPQKCSCERHERNTHPGTCAFSGCSHAHLFEPATILLNSNCFDVFLEKMGVFDKNKYGTYDTNYNNYSNFDAKRGSFRRQSWTPFQFLWFVPLGRSVEKKKCVSNHGHRQRVCVKSNVIGEKKEHTNRAPILRYAGCRNWNRTVARSPVRRI